MNQKNFKPSEEQFRRISLVRYLFSRAKDEQEQPLPTLALSLLYMHDAVEMLLIVISELTDAENTSKAEFLQYWDKIEKAKSPIKLSLFSQMKKLNQARIALKHHGIIPDEKTIKEIFSSTENFLNDSIQNILSCDLDEISLADLIQNIKIRARLKEAESALNQDDVESALRHLSAAFYYGIKTQPTIGNLHEDISAVLRNLSNRSSAVRNSENASSLFAHSIQAIGKIALLLTNGLTMVSLNLKMSDYSFFIKTVPAISVTHSGNEFFQERMKNVSKADAQRCYRFIIDSVMKIEKNI